MSEDSLRSIHTRPLVVGLALDNRQANTCIMLSVSLEAAAMDSVFKALADPTRRLLLDRLREHNGQTLRELCEHLDMKVKTPFLDEEFASFAKSIGVNDKVGEHRGRKWGKFVLRKCFETTLGDLTWRPKLAQEQGAATDKYQNYVEEMIDDLTFKNKARIVQEQDNVAIRNKEHLNYYAIFRSYFPPPKEEDCKSRCPQCHGCMLPDGRFCRTCGAFPITPESL